MKPSLLAPTLALTLIAGPVWADNIGVGVGKFLNNTNAERPGYTYLFEATKSNIVSRVGLQINYTRVSKTYLADDATFTALSLVWEPPSNNWQVGVGIFGKVVYDVGLNWDREHPDKDQSKHRTGKHYKHPIGVYSNSCDWCGTVLQAQYNIDQHWFVRGTYTVLGQISPTYNGTALAVGYRFL